jgi:hypothetical protein
VLQSCHVPPHLTSYSPLLTSLPPSHIIAICVHWLDAGNAKPSNDNGTTIAQDGNGAEDTAERREMIEMAVDGALHVGS